MSNETSTLKGWRSVQVYTLSAICLLIGITMGYLVRGSTAGKAPSDAPAATGPGSNIPMGSDQPTAGDMKRMAEKQVAPLLEELKSKPNDPELLAKVAHFYMVAQQYSDGAAYYEKVVAVKPTAENYTNLGNAYYYAGQEDKAIAALNKAIQIEPTHTNALYNLGVLKWQVQGDSKGAVEVWEKLLKNKLDDQQRAQVQKMITNAKKHATMPAGTKTDKPAM